jgi:hypothetical protein
MRLYYASLWGHKKSSSSESMKSALTNNLYLPTPQNKQEIRQLKGAQYSSHHTKW